MTKEEAEEYAKTMTYRNAVYNLTRAKCIPYRRATLIKVYELLDILDKIRDEIESQRIEASNKNSENKELQAFCFGLNDGLKDARDTIDKYIAESKEKMKGEEDEVN